MEFANVAFSNLAAPFYRTHTPVLKQPNLSPRRQQSTRLTSLRSTAFLPGCWIHLRQARDPMLPFSFSIQCADENQTKEDGDSGQEEKHFVNKFDPHSDTDAFGRDPRKETEFWMGAAKSVLESDEVQDAIAKHAADGGDGLSDEQRAYLEFIKSLDAKKSDDE